MSRSSGTTRPSLVAGSPTTADAAARSTVRAVLSTVVALGLVVGVAAGAGAWWSASRTVTVTASAGTVTAPGAPSCQTTGNPSARSATITWPAASPAPASYLVTFTGGGKTATHSTTTRQVVVTENFLEGLSDSLLQLLLDGTTVTATVQSVHSSGWRSASTSGVPLRGADIDDRGRSGVVCG